MKEDFKLSNNVLN